MELPVLIRLPQSVISRFFLAMRGVVQQKQWLIEENLFCFGLDNVMFFRAFSGISIIPIEARYCCHVNHVRILPSYTSVASSDNKLFLSDQGKLSWRLHAQPPRQSTLAQEQGRYAAKAGPDKPSGQGINED